MNYTDEIRDIQEQIELVKEAANNTADSARKQAEEVRVQMVDLLTSADIFDQFAALEQQRSGLQASLDSALKVYNDEDATYRAALTYMRAKQAKQEQSTQVDAVVEEPVEEPVVDVVEEEDPPKKSSIPFLKRSKR